METQNLSVAGKQALNLIEFDAAEKIVCEIRKHPFGLLLVWLTGLVIATALMLAAVLFVVLVNDESVTNGANASSIAGIVAVIGFFLVLLVLLATTITAYLYRKNVVLVTSEKIAEVLYPTLFNRSITQFAIEDIQNVTIKQNGFFPHIFNYGTLLVETAGESENLTFTFTPMPHSFAKQIVAAREQYINTHN